MPLYGSRTSRLKSVVPRSASMSPGNQELQDKESALQQYTLLIGGGGGLVVKSCLTLATPWTVARQAPLSMGFSRQEYWSELPLPADL